MSAPAVEELHTASELRLDDVGRLELEPDVRQTTDGAGGGPTPPGSPPRRRPRGYGGGRLPRWQVLAVWAGLTLLAFMLGVGLGRVERRILEARG